MVMDSRVEVRDYQQTPAQVKPVVKTIMRDLKQRFPQIKYIEAFNEPDHNLAKALKPDALYDYYRVYYQAVNEINQELKPTIPLQVGGPGFMQYNEPWLRAFLDGYSADPAADKRLDFISWHAYGEFPEGDGGSDGPRAYHFYKGDPSEVAGQRAKLNAELRSRGLDENIPAFITESGIYPGPSFDHQNDPKPDYLIGAAGVPSLHYWYMEQDNIVPFNWAASQVGRAQGSTGHPRRRGRADSPPACHTYGNALVMMSKLKDERRGAIRHAGRW
ncbi:MAG: cellulase family glycosylhydrolase [Haliea sp.]|nr:cellulase family glycosylhydrolase [Haliea sp.]